jgi:hypothetical protein
MLRNSPYAEDLETLTPDPSPSGRGEKSPSGGCAPATLVYKPKYRLKEIRIPRNISYVKVLKPSPLALLPQGGGNRALAGAAPLWPIASRFWRHYST